MGLASCDEEYDECPFWEEYEQCQADLEADYADSAEVILYSMEQLWGEDAIDRAKGLLENGATDWDDGQQARLHEKLVQQYGFQDNDALVVVHGRQATALDESIDLSLMIARSLNNQGLKSEAVSAVVDQLSISTDYWVLIQKVQFLHELGEHERAARALDNLEVPPDAQPDYVLYAKVWRSAGRAAQAREALVAAAESDWMEWRSAEVHQERFRFELEHGDERSASAYYDKFRDEGYSVDPFLRNRFRLAAAHPGAPWRARDLLGFLTIAGLIVGMALIPLMVVLPVHYVGLLRARSRPELFPGKTRWRLRHGWYVLGLTVITEIPFLYMEGVTVLEEAFFEVLGSVSFGYAVETIPDESLALGGLLTAALVLVGLLPILRRSDRTLFGLGSWSAIRTIGFAIGGVFALRVLWAIWNVFVLIARYATSEAASIVPWAAPYLYQMLRSIGEVYGFPVLFLFVCVAVPIGEEIVFRGVLLQAFQRHLGFGWANFIQAVLFASLHEGWSTFPFLVGLGMIAGYYARKSGSLLCPILFHALNNTIAFAVLAWVMSRT